MSAWHLYPTFLRSRDGGHTRVLLVFDATGRRTVGVGPAADGPTAAATLHLLATTEGGWPDEIRRLPNPGSDDLDQALDAVLTDNGLHTELLSAELLSVDQLDEDLVWALDQGRAASAALQCHTASEAIEATHVALDWDERPTGRPESLS